VTIALVVKVNDGYVLASDSATTVQAQLPQGGVAVANIYNNANKIFNLRKGFPLSAMTWGLGNIGPASIATLAKDLRVRLSGESPKHKGWALKPDSYTMTEVAARFKEFFYGEHYEPLVKSAGNQTGVLGLSVAGYGAGEDQPQIFQYELSPTGCVETELLVNDTGAQWWGQIDAISRLLLGVSVFTPQALMNLKLAKDEAKAVTLAQDITSQINVPIVGPAMPIQDAIDLAEFLVQVTIGFVRFCPGNPTVGGPIEIAAVTKHEGFRWVQRKHYFDAMLNPSTGRTE
jgi:hypothetical protein